MNEVEYILRIVLKARDELAAALKKAREELRLFAKAADDNAGKIDAFNKSIEAMDKNVTNITNKFREWRAVIEGAGRGNADAKKSFGELGREVDSASKATKRHADEQERAARAQDNLLKSADKLRNEYIDLQKVEKQSDRDRGFTLFRLKAIGTELERISKRVNDPDIQKFYYNWAQDSKRAADSIISDAKRIDKAAEDTLKNEEERAKKRQSIRDRDKAALQAFARSREALANIAAARESKTELTLVDHDRVEQASKDLTEVSKRFERSSKMAENLRVRSSLLSREMRNLGQDLRTVGKDTDRTTSAFQRLRGALRDNSSSIATLDNQMRGLGLLLVVGFAQQLITVLGGLAGSFVAVAGSAAYAGSAIGGIFVAGIGQALPAIGLLGAALFRVKGVMDAVKQSQLAQQQGAVQAATANRRSADAGDTLREAQERLNKARQDARKDLQDLILAEKQAELAARGAVLSQAEAQDQLRQAVASGNVGAVDRAQLGILEANLDVEDKLLKAKRARHDADKAVAGGPEQMPGVQQASQQLETAKRNAQEAAAGTETAVAKLNFLLAQLSPAERRLYTAVTNIQQIFRQGVYRDITDVLISSFARSVEKISDIIQMPKVVGEARRTAKTLGAQLNRMFDDFTSDKMVNQFLRIAEAGRKNLAPLREIITNVGKSLINIAEEAGPSYRRFLLFISDLVDKFLALTENRKGMEEFFSTGEKHLEAWVKLGVAVIRLFLALSGAGGAASGLRTVNDATKAVDGLTKKVQDNAKDVGKFFEQSRGVLNEVVGVVAALAEELFKVWKPERVHAFADLLKKVVIPALGDVIEYLGLVTDALIDFANTPAGGFLIRAGIAFLLLNRVVSSLFGSFKLFHTILGPISKVLFDIAKETAGADASFGKILLTMGRIVLTVGRFALIGTGIIAVAAGVIILLDKLGLLDDAWRAVKSGFEAFWKEVGPSIKNLVKQFQDLWKAVSEGKGLFGVLVDVLRPLLKIIIEVGGIFLRVFGRTLGRIIGGLIDVLSGLIEFLTGVFSGDWRKAWAGIRHMFGGIIRAVTATLRAFPELVLEIAKKVAPAFRKGIEALWEWLKKLPQRLGNLAADAAEAFVKGFKNVGSDIIKGILGGLKGLGGFAKDIANAFIDLLNHLLPNKITLTGAPDINLPDNPIPHLAKGGPIIGTGRGDKYPALLEADEHVWTRDEVRAAGGHGAMYALRRYFGGGGQSSGGRYAEGGKPVSPGALTITFVGGGMDDFAGQWRQFWNLTVSITRRGTLAVELHFREMRVATERTIDRMVRDIAHDLTRLVNIFRTSEKLIRSSWRDMWDDLKLLAYQGLNYIGHEANKSLDAFGAKTINFGLTAPAEGKAGGGFLGGKGQRGRDKGLYALGAGEAVLNWQHQKYVEPAMNYYYGHGLDDMFRRTHGYHAGGAEQPGLAAGGRGGDTHLSRLIAAANKVDKMHLPYVWGGGHQQPAVIGSGMDCSGTVSYLTQQAGYKVPTTTSGSMGSWGFPSGGNGATVFYNDGHTFMRIGNRYFGTTGFGHPGWTGAGWFTQNPGAGYLAGFKQMHLPGIDKVGDFMTSVGGDLARLLVKGPASPIKEMFQKMFDTVTDAANKYIGEKSSDLPPGSGQDVDVTSVPAGAEGIFRFFRGQGFTDEQAAAWVGNFTQESGLNPGAVQPGGPGRGLAQWGGGRYDALVAFAARHGKPWNDLGTQLAFVMYELHGSESSAYNQIKGASSLESAVDAVGVGYERFGIQGDRYGPARAALQRFGGQFAEGGIVPGPEGAPVPIIAHAREWILNSGQVNRLASLVGTSRDTLKSMLGFYGGGGSFAGGGEAPSLKFEEGDRPFLTTAIQKRLENIRKGLYTLSVVPIESWEGVLRESRRVFTALAAKAKDRARDVETLKKFTQDGGVLDQLDAARERYSAALSRNLTFASFHFNRATRRVSQRSRIDTEIETTSRELAMARGEMNKILQEESQITKALKRTNARLRQLRRGGVEKGEAAEVAELAAVQANLRERRRTIRDTHAAQLEKIFQAQVARQQAIADEITTRFEREGTGRDLLMRISQALGDEGTIAKLNTAQRDMLTRQADELEGRIAAARRAGAGDLADQLASQVADLRVQIFESIQQELRDAMDRINARAQRRTGRLDLAGRMLDAVGAVGLGSVAGLAGEQFTRGGLFAQRGTVLEQQRTDLQGVLRQAESQRNIALIQELTDALAELDVSIQENIKAGFDARVEDVNSRAGFALNVNDLNKQIAELEGTIGGQIDQAKITALLQERGNILADQRLQLEQLLAEAQATGNQQAVNDLTIALLENRVAILNNTQAVNEATGAMTQPQTFTSSAWTRFREAIFNGMGQVLPQYNPQNMMGEINTGAVIVPAGATSSRVSGDTNINLYEAGRPVDLQEVSAAVTFASKTAQ